MNSVMIMIGWLFVTTPWRDWEWWVGVSGNGYRVSGGFGSGGFEYWVYRLYHTFSYFDRDTERKREG